MRVVLILFLAILVSCSSSNKKIKKEKPATKKEQVKTQNSKPKVSFDKLSESVFKIETYDGKRILETGKCFAVAPHIIVAPFSLFRDANRAVLTPSGGGAKIEVSNYVAYDRINNLILLSVDSVQLKPLKMYVGKTTQGIKTIVIGQKHGNTLQLLTGKCNQEQVQQGQRLFHISNVVERSNFGNPIFVSNGTVLGMGISKDIMYQRTYFAVPARQILTLIKKAGTPKALKQLSNPNATLNSKIKHITLETDFGNISIKLFNETPAYRDNFVQLTEEGFFDSLLIHRVIRDFGIQSGAADTRHAQFDDIVGWMGPGYTIPAHFVEGLYHKRGVIGSPRKPDTKNAKLRSDGSQFYIVTGRKYFDSELDEIEDDNGIKFTTEQREVYKTIGGAPHLDGSYTVFGEVISGIEVADRISIVATKTDFRPLKDIRLKKVKIEY